jgi:D-alanyl-D-alanine carboxypeptidase
MLRPSLAALLLGGLLIGVAGCAVEREPLVLDPTPTPSATRTPSPTPTPTPIPTPTFDRAQNSIDDPTSIWVVVNKLRPLQPAGYVPPDLRVAQIAATQELAMRDATATAAEAMFAEAAAAGVPLRLNSAYRSFESQTRINSQLVQQLGQERADIASARPGHSEHQTGFAIDVGATSGVCELQACFGTTPQGVWLVENAHRFGFILRYPDGLTGITGYAYEPWHWRYVGVELAAEMRATGVATLEEFFGLPPAPTYAG